MLRFTVMTYNVHKGIGGIDRKYRLDRIVEVISDYDPDVLLLQEVDDGVPRSRSERQIDMLGDALGFPHRAYQPNVHLRRGKYGNAILSRFAFRDQFDIELTVKPKKRRRAQLVKLRITGEDSKRTGDSASRHASRTAIIVNLHLGLAAFERRIQLRRLLQNESLLHAHRTTPIVVAGDFNDVWHNLGKKSLGEQQFESALGKVKTFPAFYPMRCLDGIYYRGPLHKLRGFIGHTEVARQASDHLPAIAEFEVMVD